ncbi:MAG: class I SAM-dependent methyltransferase [Bryobacteraceae bacterium]
MPPHLVEYVASPERARFDQIMPITPDGLILDLGAGLGGISAELAKEYRVIALEGVAERASFISIRARQDNMVRNLAVMNGDLNTVRFAPEQFDAVVVNGVLEWVGLFDASKPVSQVQIEFMQSLRKLLVPGGIVYVGIENRIGWNQLRGTPDHSGLKYTSLMPRFMAEWVCRRGTGYRAALNSGYRTYTYTRWGYARLFKAAGLRIRSLHIAPRGYNYPTDLIPLRGNAIRHYAGRRAMPALDFKPRLKKALKIAFATEWFWSAFGADFVFMLEADGA